METIITILMIIVFAAIFIAIAPYLLALVAIIAIIAVIGIIYMRHKLKKYQDNHPMDEWEDTYVNTDTKRTSSDDIIDVEYTETTESEDSHD